MTTSAPDERPPLVDPRVDRAWREASREEPPASIDAALIAAAHRDAGAGPRPVGAREARAARRQWWPLAAAATVAAIAVGVLQLAPREELGAPAAEKAVVSDMPEPVAKVAPPSAALAPLADEPRQSGGSAAPVRKEISREDASRRPAAAADAPEPRRQAPAPARVSPPVPEPFPGTPKLAADAPKPSAAPLAEPMSPQEAPRSPAAAGNMSMGRVTPPRDAAATPETVAPPIAPAPRTEAPASRTEAPASRTEAPPPRTEAPAPRTEAPAPRAEGPASRMSERASAAPAPAPLAKMAAGREADAGNNDARIKDRAPLPIADWIALIRRLRDEGNRAEAAKELAAFRAAHLDHEKLLPPDLRNWRPAEK